MGFIDRPTYKFPECDPNNKNLRLLHFNEKGTKEIKRKN